MSELPLAEKFTYNMGFMRHEDFPEWTLEISETSHQDPRERFSAFLKCAGPTMASGHAFASSASDAVIAAFADCEPAVKKMGYDTDRVVQAPPIGPYLSAIRPRFIRPPLNMGPGLLP